jgi:hypothetical protein
LEVIFYKILKITLRTINSDILIKDLVNKLLGERSQNCFIIKLKRIQPENNKQLLILVNSHELRWQVVVNIKSTMQIETK